MATDEKFNEIKDNITAALVKTTKAVAAVAAEDLSFQRSLNPTITEVLATQQARLLNISQSLINIATSRTGVDAPRLKDADGIESEWSSLVDVFDNLLERTDACLDEYSGIIKKPDLATPLLGNSREPREVSVYSRRSQNILKPQRLFRRTPNNQDETPFKPLLQNKPHALKPLHESLTLREDENGRETYDHPYKNEIEAYAYPPNMYSSSEPIAPPSFASTTATYVDTLDGVKAMLEELTTAKEIAVDLEHHDTYSYVGIVSLMQISTRAKDWIIDTLQPWREDLQILNEIFADPAILKVFHGSTMDIIWLQRDLGLYVVGLFDTFHACRLLNHPKKSLKALLERYVGFQAQKQYQMADWRTRPLPDAMFEYARSDTHFLLYIHDQLRNELIKASPSAEPEEDLLKLVLESSKEESLQTYLRPIYDEEGGTGVGGWSSYLRSVPALLNGEQLAVYKVLHYWRDQVARREDTNPGVVMNREVLFSIARAMPENVHALLGSHQPFPANLRPRKEEILALISKAKEDANSSPALQESSASKASAHVVGNTTEEIELQIGRNVERSPLNQKISDQMNRCVPLTSQSVLWGETLQSTLTVQPQVLAAENSAHILLVPVPPSGMVPGNPPSDMADQGDVKMTDTIHQRGVSPAISQPDQAVEDTFIARDLGRPRKRKLHDGHDDVQRSHRNGTNDYHNKEDQDVNYSPSALQSEPAELTAEMRAQLKNERKKRRRQKNRLKLEAREKEQKEAPFDYTNAPSMLQVAASPVVHNNSQKPVNPYVKSLEAPQGARKVQREKPGKSQTFKT